MERPKFYLSDVSRRSVLSKLIGFPVLAGIAIPLMAMRQGALDQDNWRWCYKCEGLWFAGNPGSGACPADGQGHALDGSGDYTLLFSSDTSASGQGNWRWCYKCAGLWFAGHSTHGVCPYDADEHSLRGSGEYILVDSWGQDNWRWCHKCEGLWFAGHPTHGACPADGQEHSRKGSGDYILE